MQLNTMGSSCQSAQGSGEQKVEPTRSSPLPFLPPSASPPFLPSLLPSPHHRALNPPGHRLPALAQAVLHLHKTTGREKMLQHQEDASQLPPDPRNSALMPLSGAARLAGHGFIPELNTRRQIALNLY